MKVKEESEKFGLKLNIQKTKIMASDPIISWPIDGETMETVPDYFLGLQNHCRWSHEIKRCLLLGRKAMSNLDSILKSRDITLPTKFCLVKAMVFPVVMYGCELDYNESWVLKNWCFWTVVLEKTVLNVLWKDWCRSWNSKTLATWCEELTHWKRPWCWERLKAGGEGDDRGWDGWMASLTQWTWVWVNSGNWWWTGRPGMLRSMGLQRVGHDWATELPNRWGKRAKCFPSTERKQF